MSPASPCLDDNLLAGWAEGRLAGERLALVEEHLLACDDCRRLAADLRGDAAPAAPVLRLEARRARPRASAWAAVLLLALAAGLAFALRARSPRETGDTDARLVAAAARLRTAAPDEFGDFAPYDAGARRAVEGDVTRGAFTVLEPAETVLFTRPSLRFTPVPGAKAYGATLSDAEGKALWTGAVQAGEGWPSGAPELAYGSTYVLEVSAVGAPQRAVATRAFRVVSRAQERRFAAAERRVRQDADEDLYLLLMAHLSARWGLWVNAETCAAAEVARRPDDPVARETLAMVRRRLGWPEDATPR